MPITVGFVGMGYDLRQDTVDTLARAFAVPSLMQLVIRDQPWSTHSEEHVERIAHGVRPLLPVLRISEPEVSETARLLVDQAKQELDFRNFIVAEIAVRSNLVIMQRERSDSGHTMLATKCATMLRLPWVKVDINGDVESWVPTLAKA